MRFDCGCVVYFIVDRKCTVNFCERHFKLIWDGTQRIKELSVEVKE